MGNLFSFQSPLFFSVQKTGIRQETDWKKSQSQIQCYSVLCALPSAQCPVPSAQCPVPFGQGQRAQHKKAAKDNSQKSTLGLSKEYIFCAPVPSALFIGEGVYEKIAFLPQGCYVVVPFGQPSALCYCSPCLVVLLTLRFRGNKKQAEPTQGTTRVQGYVRLVQFSLLGTLLASGSGHGKAMHPWFFISIVNHLRGTGLQRLHVPVKSSISGG